MSLTFLEPLDNAPWHSIRGAHAFLAERRGLAARYAPDVSPFAAVPDVPEEADWEDLAALVGPGQTVVLFRAPVALPERWRVVRQGTALQFVGERFEVATEPDAVVLGTGDVPEMLRLVGRTQPGPFLARTVELGTYLGLRVDGELVAMAGERFHLPGWTEISAVCTDASYRGRRLATRLVRAVGWGIRQREAVPFLHVAADNTDAIRLYRQLGFTLRREIPVVVALTPGRPVAPTPGA